MSDPKKAGAMRPASLARMKRELRRETKRRAIEPEINFLNITAMMDMMTIILVFLLKSLSTSTASLPQSNDLELPKSVLVTDPDGEPEGLMVVVSKSQIMVGETVVCTVPSDAKEAGIEERYRNGSRNSLGIVPLEQSLRAWRDVDRQMRRAAKKDESYSEAIVVVDKDIPYRVVTEVLFTLGQSEFAKFHMMVHQSSK